MSKIKLAWTPHNELVEIIENPCGCHKFDVTITYIQAYRAQSKSFSYSFMSYQHRTAWYKRRKFIDVF